MKTLSLKKIILLLTVLSVVFISLSFVYAIEIKTSKESSSLIIKDIYEAGKNLVQNDTIAGDYIAAGQDIKVNTKTIEGDVLSAAKNIYVSGTILGNVRTAAQYVNITGNIGKNLNIFAQDAVVDNKTIIYKNALICSETSNISGKINGNLTIFSNNVELEGEFLGEVYVDTGKEGTLTIKPGTKIIGNLIHKGIKEAIISPDTTIGKTDWEKTTPVEKEAGNKQFQNIINYIKILITTLLYFLIGLFLLKLFPKASNMQLEAISTRPIHVLGKGLLTLAVIAALFILGIILLVLSFWMYSPSIPLVLGIIITGFFAAISFFSYIPISVWLGKLMFKDRIKPVYSFLISLLSIKILTEILNQLSKYFMPFGILAFLINTTILLFGIGAIMISFSEIFKDVLKLQKEKELELE